MTSQRRTGFRSKVVDFIYTIFSAQFWNGVKSDFREIYNFYLNEDDRRRLRGMKPIRRSFHTAILITRALYRKLNPFRQVLLILAFILFLLPNSSWQGEEVKFSMQWAPIAFIVLLFILMLELKDKLLARDELEVGHKVQEALMPRDNPHVGGWDVWLFTKPANDVSGDLVDYLQSSPDSADIALADVAGKGLGAALLTSKLQATLRALAPDMLSLAELGSKVNVIFCRDGLPSRFATLVYARITADSGTVRLLNAGHLPPIILSDAKTEELPRMAPAIGLTQSAQFTEQECSLSPGDTLVVYSDGVTEARNADNEFYGEERLRALLATFRNVSAEEIGKTILGEVERFLGVQPRTDDISIAVLQRK